MAPIPEEQACPWEGESEFPLPSPQAEVAVVVAETGVRRTERFQIDTRGRFSVPNDLYELIEDLFPPELRQEVELPTDLRGGMALRCIVGPPRDGRRECWARNLPEICRRLNAHGVQASWFMQHLQYSADAVTENVRNRTLRLLVTNGVFESCRFAQLDVNGLAAAVEIIADFCRAFPEARIVIPLTTRAEAKQVQRMLRQSLPEPIGWMAGLRAKPRARINLATPRGALSADSVAGAVVLIPFLADVPRDWMRRLHCSGAPGRVYLLRERRDRDATVERELELRYGPVLTSIERATHQCTMVNFGGQGSRSPAPPAERLEKRGRYWCHDRRNQFVASLANEMRTRYSGSSGSEPMGIVLVENLEHGRQLQRWLQDWPLIGRTGRPAGGARYVITTLPAIERATPRPRWVINAMGGAPSTYLIDWLDRVAGRFFETHLVDLTDGFRVETGHLSMSREQRYRDAGLAMTTLPEQILGPARQNAFG